MYKRILVAVDGSAPSMLGLQEAIRLAKASGATLKLVYVVDLSFMYLGDAAVALGSVMESLREAGGKVLADCKATAAKAEVPCEQTLIEGAAGAIADEIVAEAARWKADLMVLGTHGRRGLKRLALGSDAELVVRKSPVPVLLVRDRAGEAQ